MKPLYFYPLFIAILLSLTFALPVSDASAKSPGIHSGEGETAVSERSSAKRVYFKDLRKYPMRNRPVPEEIMALDGQEVTIVGYMVPFDRIENITQFILLQAPFMGCLHVPPPQANETLMITTENPLSKYTYDPLRITGTLEIDEVYIDGYLISVYTIAASDIRPSTREDAELDDLPPNFHFYGDM